MTAKSASGTVAQIYAEVRKTRFPHRDLHTVLNSQVLVLNRLWQAVNICTARRAFALVYAGHAQIVSSDEPNNFMTHDFQSWRDLSANAPDHEVVTTISFKIRVPRVIVLLVFDRLPKKEVKFTRHNVFERDKNTCQYCGDIFDRSGARQEHLPILRRHFRPQRTQPRSRRAARSRWDHDMGKRRLFVHRLQYAQGQSASA